MAAAADMKKKVRSAQFWSGRTLSKTYTDPEIAAVGDGTFRPAAGHPYADKVSREAKRTIPLLSLPTGAMFFHYCTIPTRNAGESDAAYHLRLADNFFGQFGIPITWNAEQNGWVFCFGSAVADYHYYYGTPCAGFGVSESYNAALITCTKRSSKWAYLKSGFNVKNKVINHRRVPISDGFTNYDYKRIQPCNRIDSENKSCRVGKLYDICISPEFMKEYEVDGVTSIAGMDDLMDVRKVYGTYNFDTDRPMYRALNTWSNQVMTGNHIDDYLVYTTNLLALETDYRPLGNKLCVGFKEYCCGPFGYKHTNLKTIPPDTLPAAQFGAKGTNYAILESKYAGGKCTKRRIAVDVAHVVPFFRKYVAPHLLMKSLQIVTPWGRLDTLAAGFAPNHLAPIAGNIDPGYYGVGSAATNRYNLNHRIAEYFYALCNQENPGIGWDMRLNVLIRLHPDHSNMNSMLDISFRMRDEHIAALPAADPFKAPPHQRHGYKQGWYMYPLKANGEYLHIMEALKLAHEFISNVKWRSHWMHEILFRLPFGGNDKVGMPIGPFYNPLALPISSFDDLAEVYKGIITNLEDGAVRHSKTYILLNTVADFNYYKEWYNHNPANHSFYTPTSTGVQQQYVVGKWFFNLAPANGFYRPASVQEGGFHTGTQRTSKHTNRGTARATKSKRTATKKKRRSPQTRKTSFLTDPTFRNNLVTNLLKESLAHSKRTMNQPNNSETNTTTKNESTEGRHTSLDCTSMDLDTVRGLIGMLNSPITGPIMRELLGGGDDGRSYKVENDFKFTGTSEGDKNGPAIAMKRNTSKNGSS
jgi:hypothetical protein